MPKCNSLSIRRQSKGHSVFISHLPGCCTALPAPAPSHTATACARGCRYRSPCPPCPLRTRRTGEDKLAWIRTKEWVIHTQYNIPDFGSHPAPRHIPGCSFSHWTMRAYSMQCSGNRGVLAIVHSGYVRLGGYSDMVHSKHAVCPGTMTRTCPLNPVLGSASFGELSFQ